MEQSSPLDFSMRRKNAPSPLDLSNVFHGTSDAPAPLHQSNHDTISGSTLPPNGTPSMLQQSNPVAVMPPSAGSLNVGPTNAFLPPNVLALNNGPSNGGVISPATTDSLLPTNTSARKPRPKKSLFAPHAGLSHPSATTPILPLRAPVSHQGPFIPPFPLSGGLSIPGSANSFFPPGVSLPGPTNFMFPLNPGRINLLLPPNPGSANMLLPSIPGPSNPYFPPIPGGPNVFFAPNANITWELEKLGISDTSCTSGTASPSTPTTPNTPNTPIQFDNSNAIGPMRTSEYIEKRRKNNESARRSRTRKREHEDDLTHRTELLEQQNVQLKCKLAQIQHRIEVVRAAVMQKNINNQQFRYNWNGFR